MSGKEFLILAIIAFVMASLFTWQLWIELIR